MARTPKPVDPAKALRKLLKTLRNGDADEEAGLVSELTALLDATPDLLATVDTLRVLAHAAENGALDVLELLLARGADPRLKTRDDASSCLASVLTGADTTRALAIAERMVARGSDPNERGDRTSPMHRAVDAGLPVVDALIRLGADEASARFALPHAVSRAADDPDRAPIVQRLLAHIADLDAPGPDGLSPLHIVALHGTPDLLTPVLARSRDLAHRVTVLAYYTADSCSPPGGGIVPALQLAPGATARDLVDAALHIHDLAIAWYGDAGYRARDRARRRDQLAAVLALLGERGVPFGAPRRPSLPAFVPEIDALLIRLAEHVGGDPDALRRIAAAIMTDEMGPWNYSSTLLERSRPVLLRGVVAERLQNSWLAHLIAGDHQRFLTAYRARVGRNKPDPADYTEDARRPLELGVIVGGRDERTLLLVWRHAEGVARIGAAAPDRFELLGDDILDFLRRQLRDLGVAVDDIAAGTAVGPRGRGPALLRADYDTPPGPGVINRVGGLPIGLAEWPYLDDAPMHHVLTLDLADHPDYRPAGARALALFISSPSGHEAYAPHNPHTRVLLLSDADLARGELPLPAALADDDLLRPGTLHLTSGTGMTQRELYQHSFAGGDPIWLQGDESDGDYDSDYDDGDDEDDDPRKPPPRDFVLQFDEKLIPGINLGDLGIMYVFGETAWFQCH